MWQIKKDKFSCFFFFLSLFLQLQTNKDGLVEVSGFFSNYKQRFVPGSDYTIYWLIDFFFFCGCSWRSLCQITQAYCPVSCTGEWPHSNYDADHTLPHHHELSPREHSFFKGTSNPNPGPWHYSLWSEGPTTAAVLEPKVIYNTYYVFYTDYPASDIDLSPFCRKVSGVLLVFAEPPGAFTIESHFIWWMAIVILHF